jgi:hypothetical protein
MSGVQPGTLPNPTKVMNILCGYGVKGVSVVQGAVPCQQHQINVHAVRDAMNFVHNLA